MKVLVTYKSLIGIVNTKKNYLIASITKSKIVQFKILLSKKGLFSQAPNKNGPFNFFHVIEKIYKSV